MPALSLDRIRAWGAADWLDLGARLLIAIVFIAAGLPKLLNPTDFAEAIGNYQLVPDAWAGALAVFLPPLELLVAGCLLAGVAARGAALIAAGMLAVFAIAIAQTVMRGIDIDCGCFGAAAEATASWWSVARNLALLLAAGFVALRRPKAVDDTPPS